MNFGETHNDHLQTAAETGIPGYALLFSAVILVLIGTRRRVAAKSPALKFVQTVSLPLAVGAFLVMLGQFPLQLAAPRMMFLYAGVMCITVSRNAK